MLRHEDLVFHYRRGVGGTETRLRAKRSVGIGGHINDADAGAADPYHAGMMRELTEEVDIASGYEQQFLGVLFDPSTEVGKVHLGLVHLFRLDAPAVTAREAGIADGGFAAVRQLLADRDQFETWSQLALAALLS
jgi:predicted NUDIX family phosphoesterase